MKRFILMVMLGIGFLLTTAPSANGHANSSDEHVFAYCDVQETATFEAVTFEVQTAAPDSRCMYVLNQYPEPSFAPVIKNQSQKRVAKYEARKADRFTKRLYPNKLRAYHLKT